MIWTKLHYIERLSHHRAENLRARWREILEVLNSLKWHVCANCAWYATILPHLYNQDKHLNFWNGNLGNLPFSPCVHVVFQSGMLRRTYFYPFKLCPKAKRQKRTSLPGFNGTKKFTQTFLTQHFSRK